MPLGKLFSLRICTQRIPLWHIVVLLPLLILRIFAQLSLNMILHSCQIHAVLPYVRGLHRMISLHGKIWFYARNVIFSKKCCMRHILESLKRNVRGHAETCLLIIFSSHGCAVFSPIFLSNFLGRCSNHEKIKKTCTFGRCPEVWLSRHGLTFHGVGWWERARWVRTEQQNVHRSRLGAKSMIHSYTMRKPKNTQKKKKHTKTQGPECLRHRVVFFGFVLFFCFLVFVCNFARPKGRMQRVESCHLFAVLHAPRQRKIQRVESCHLFAVLHAPRQRYIELSLVICLFSCQSMHMSKQRMCKEECKKRTLAIPCSENPPPDDHFPLNHLFDEHVQLQRVMSSWAWSASQYLKWSIWALTHAREFSNFLF